MGTKNERREEATESTKVVRFSDNMAPEMGSMLSRTTRGRVKSDGNASKVDNKRSREHNNKKVRPTFLDAGTLQYVDGSYTGQLNPAGEREGYGFMKYTNGSSYKGEWLRGKFHGRGIFLFASGAQYNGGWRNGKQDGTGIYFSPQGDLLEGEWKDGSYLHNQEITMLGLHESEELFVDGTYKGQINQAGEREGYGFMQYNNGSRYEGEWKENKFDGHGTFWYVSGTLFEGGWKNGKQQGKGTYYTPKGIRHEGTYMEGFWKCEATDLYDESALKGLCAETVEFGDGTYTGQLRHGGREGFGFMRFTNGSTYTGDWRRDKFHGYGTYAFASGAQYQGEWKNGKRDGKGVYRASKGNSYGGEWKDGVWEGADSKTDCEKSGKIHDDSVKEIFTPEIAHVRKHMLGISFPFPESSRPDHEEDEARSDVSEAEESVWSEEGDREVGYFPSVQESKEHEEDKENQVVRPPKSHRDRCARTAERRGASDNTTLRKEIMQFMISTRASLIHE